MSTNYGTYVKGHAMGTCLRNHLMLHEMKEGRGPIFMDTPTAMKKLAENMTPEEIKHLEAEAWEDFLDMTIPQCGVWAGENIEPDKDNVGTDAHRALLAGIPRGLRRSLVLRPRRHSRHPNHYHWGYNRMSTVQGLFTAGDGVGRIRAQVLQRLLYRRPYSRQVDGQVRHGQQGLAAGDGPHPR